jgi:hypothetical protein
MTTNEKESKLVPKLDEKKIKEETQELIKMLQMIF